MSRDYGEEGTFDDVEYFVVVQEMLFMNSRMWDAEGNREDRDMLDLARGGVLERVCPMFGLTHEFLVVVHAYIPEHVYLDMDIGCC